MLAVLEGEAIKVEWPCTEIPKWLRPPGFRKEEKKSQRGWNSLHSLDLDFEPSHVKPEQPHRRAGVLWNSSALLLRQSHMSAQAGARGVPGSEQSRPHQGGIHSTSPSRGLGAATKRGESRARWGQRSQHPPLPRAVVGNSWPRLQPGFFLCVWVPLVEQRKCTGSITGEACEEMELLGS